MSIKIYAHGICSLSICAPKEMTELEIEDGVNSQCPTGISSRWEIAKEKKFITGEQMPCVCESDPTRKHWLLHC